MRALLHRLLLPLLLGVFLLSCSAGSRAGRSGRYGDYQLYALNSLNSSADEYGAALSPDGLRLYYVSSRPGGVGGHDFWYATRERITDTVFSNPVNMGRSINTVINEGSLTIGADGMTIFFTGCNRPDGKGDCDLYTARLDGDRVVDVRNLSEINSAWWEGQPSVTGDGRTLYFVRTDPSNGKQSMDIYSSTIGADERWSTPVRLGDPINTSAQESSPAISRDGTVLYFASARTGGYGQNDFYVSQRTAGAWGAPQHLGLPFNTAMDDRTITVTPSGLTAFIAASNGHDLDLYMITRVPATGDSTTPR